MAFNPIFNLGDLDGQNGFAITNIRNSDLTGFGSALSSAGDVNGDGFDDIVIGLGDAGSQNGPKGQRYAGESYILFGKGTGFQPSFDLSAVDGQNGLKLMGVDAYDYTGRSVSGAVDVNGDGFDDVIIGATGARGNPEKFRTGTSYIVFGRADRFRQTLNLATTNPKRVLKIIGINTRDEFGDAVSGVGDVNGDGIDDVIIGAPSTDLDGKSNTGESYVVFGQATADDVLFDVSALNGLNGFTILGDIQNGRSGNSVSDAGDVNGDGFDDIIIGAPAGRTIANDESSYIVFGQAASSARRSIRLAALDGRNGFKLTGGDGRDQFGGRVSSAGDINGDGFDDILVTAQYANRDASGNVYVVFGKATGFASNLELNRLNGRDGFVISGVNASDRLGDAVSNAGDINGDGIDDIIIGSAYADSSRPNNDPNRGNFKEGISYVIFGTTAGFSRRLDLTTLNGRNGFAIEGASFNDRSGSSVSNAGDINGDGLDDLLIGAPWADPSDSYTSRGAAYVIFGSADSGNQDAPITGTRGSDTLSGTRENDTIDGLNGNDLINGKTGDDVLIGSNGKDTLLGAAGDDELRGGNSADVLTGGNGIDLLRGGNGNDRLSGGNGNDALIGGNNNDVLDGGGGNDQLKGGKGKDLLMGGQGTDVLFGEDGKDTLNGDNGNDQLDGGADNDEIAGGAGNDQLFGGKGKDTLLGGNGDDFLLGGEGNDQLTGGAGRDIFGLEIGKGQDTITDFEHGRDRLGLDFTLSLGQLSFQGNDVLLARTSEVLYTIIGFDTTLLTQDDLTSVPF